MPRHAYFDYERTVLRCGYHKRELPEAGMTIMGPREMAKANRGLTVRQASKVVADLAAAFARDKGR